MDSLTDSKNGKRKKEHLEISLQKDVDFKKLTTGFEKYTFTHQALPESDLNEIDLSVKILGKTFFARMTDDRRKGKRTLSAGISYKD